MTGYHKWPAILNNFKILVHVYIKKENNGPGLIFLRCVGSHIFENQSKYLYRYLQ